MRRTHWFTSPRPSSTPTTETWRICATRTSVPGTCPGWRNSTKLTSCTWPRRRKRATTCTGGSLTWGSPSFPKTARDPAGSRAMASVVATISRWLDPRFSYFSMHVIAYFGVWKCYMCSHLCNCMLNLVLQCCLFKYICWCSVDRA